MKSLLIVVGAVVALGSAAFAAEPTDPEITLRASEIQVIVNKALADQAAESVLKKVREQMTPAKPVATPSHPH